MKSCLNNLFIVVFIVLVSSCNVRKELTIEEISKININEIIKSINVNEIDANWLSLKGKIKIKSNEDKLSLGINLKIRTDSLIWASINAPIIGEINRVMITQDSLYMINRSNSTWLIEPIENIKQKIGLEISYNDIERIITSSVRVPEKNYLSTIINEDLVIKDNLDSTTYTIESQKKHLKEIGVNFKNNSNLTIKYSNYNLYGSFLYANNIQVTTSESYFELNFTKVELNKNEKISFIVPKKYDEIN